MRTIFAEYKKLLKEIGAYDEQQLALLIKAYLKKEQLSFNWGALFLFIKKLSSDSDSSPAAKDGRLTAAVELFIILTDFVDDLMDQDNPEFQIISNKEAFLSSSLVVCFSAIRELVEEAQWNRFIDAAGRSLLGQFEDLSKLVTIDSKEADYFDNGANKAIYLVTAVGQLALSEPEESVERALHCLAISGQIDNDVRDILKEKSSDILDKKATLPIIKAIEASVRYQETFFFNLLYALDKDDVDFDQLKLVKNYIKESGALEYCQFLSKTYLKKARQLLIDAYPKAAIDIDAFLL